MVKDSRRIYGRAVLQARQRCITAMSVLDDLRINECVLLSYHLTNICGNVVTCGLV